jgi:hypothetical protein
MAASDLKQLLAWLRANPDNATQGLPGLPPSNTSLASFCRNGPVCDFNRRPVAASPQPCRIWFGLQRFAESLYSHQGLSILLPTIVTAGSDAVGTASAGRCATEAGSAERTRSDSTGPSLADRPRECRHGGLISPWAAAAAHFSLCRKTYISKLVSLCRKIYIKIGGFGLVIYCLVAECSSQKRSRQNRSMAQ